MTPLAHKIVKELKLPLKRRTFHDQCGMLPRMSDVHCFELSKVYGMTEDLAQKLRQCPTSACQLAFLPAPRTWIEWKCNEGPNEGRYGVLLEKTDFGASFVVAGEALFSSGRVGEIRLRDDLLVPGYDVEFLPGDNLSLSGLKYIIGTIYAALALINTPRVIGRRQYAPHRGLDHDLRCAKKNIGKFPLHAWTEIKLEVAAPRDISSDPSVEHRYTGERALHFCRAYLRVRFGRVEIVSSYWAGNEALGVKQSRYVLTSPKEMEIA